MKKLRFKFHKNGFVVTLDDDPCGLAYQEPTGDEDDEIDTWALFLWRLLDEWGPDAQKSRYSKRKIHIDIRPGDKYDPEMGMN